MAASVLLEFGLKVSGALSPLCPSQCGPEHLDPVHAECLEDLR